MTATLTELETITAAKIVDARGAACPGPLLEAKKGMGTVPVGSVIEIWSTDPGDQDRHRRLVGQGRPRVPRRPERRRLRPRPHPAREVGPTMPALADRPERCPRGRATAGAIAR